jgi:hypothetical protein
VTTYGGVDRAVLVTFNALCYFLFYFYMRNSLRRAQNDARIALRRLLLPASAEAGGAPVSPLVRLLLALGVRGLNAACSSGAPAAILDFARGCLLDGVVWPKVTQLLLTPAFLTASWDSVGAACRAT